MLRILRLLFLVIVLTLLVTAPAYAAGTDAGTELDLFDKAQLIGLLGGAILPFVVALLTNIRASKLVMSLTALVAAGLVALGTYLTDTGGATTWRGALSVFVITIITAAGTRVTITGGADDALQRKTAGFGLG